MAHQKPDRLAKRYVLPLALLVAGSASLGACDGPNAEAGRERDEAEASASGVSYGGSGPNERIGAAKDRALAAEKQVREASEAALHAQGQNMRRQADVEAVRLEEQTKAIRQEAERRAEALEKGTATAP